MNDLLARLPEPETLLAGMGRPLDPAAYAWDQAGAQPLRSDEVFQLTYATQVEWGTEGTFLSLDISEDPIVKRFLRIWLEQEVVHAALLARFLSEVGVSVELVHRRPSQQRAARRGQRTNRLARRLVGDDFFAVHMVWGAVNELMTMRFYGLIRSRTENELLRALLQDLMTQESNHYGFYRNMSIRRLTGNPRGQRIVRWVLEHLWSPVGSGLRSREDVDRLFLDLLDDHLEVVGQIDAQIGRIPGLADLDLTQRTVDRAARVRTAA